MVIGNGVFWGDMLRDQFNLVCSFVRVCMKNFKRRQISTNFLRPDTKQWRTR